MEKTAKNFNDLELTAAFGSLLDTEQVIIHDISEAKEASDGKKYFQLYISQKQTVKSENTSALDELLLGWGSRTSIVRSIRNVEESAAKAAKLQFKVGSTLSSCLNIEDLYIKVTHTRVKPYTNAEPIKANIEGNLKVMADSDNNPIYQLTKVEVMQNSKIEHEKVKLQQFVAENTLSLLEQEAGVLENN